MNLISLHYIYNNYHKEIFHFIMIYLVCLFSFASINYFFFRKDYTTAKNFIDFLYHSASVTTLVGFGDVHAKNTKTRLFILLYISLIFIYVHIRIMTGLNKG